MSADNWQNCPKCEEKMVAARNAAIAKARKAYGKIDPEKYEQMLADAREMPEDQETPTFREDYHIGLVGEDVEISYRGQCTQCGFFVEFRRP